MFDKRHSQVLRDVDIFIKKNPEMKCHFSLSTYTNSRNKVYRCYMIDEEGFNVMSNKYKYNVRSARLEYKITNELFDLFDILKIKYIPQYVVLEYRIDIFLPEHNIAIEIDEYEHKYKNEYDRIREQEIYNSIKCKFIRINEETSIGSAIAMIIKEIYKAVA